MSFAEAEWKIQGVSGTNPPKVKKAKTTSTSSDKNHLLTVKKLVFVKSCIKNMNLAIALANASSGSAKTAIKKSKDYRYTLDR